jgi:hypothetical protein
MTAATVDAPKKAPAKASSVKIELSGDPRVQLLPPSIRDRAVSRSRARAGVLLVVLGAVVAAALVGAGYLRSAQAQQSLLSAQNRGTELLAQQAQYSEAVTLDRLIRQAKQLQTGATETEIDLGPLIQRLIAMLPQGAEAASISSVNILPWEALPTSDVVGADKLADAGLVATVQLEISTVTVQDATNYSRSLRALPGALTSSINLVGVGADGRVSSTVTLLLGVEAVSGRFAEEDAEGDGTENPEQADATTGEEG